ncbi:MAG: hypothetical protein L6R36_006588 [Xanthoria steineri]|nr:MAG: hypothetical protein L6R36_006588 [Xanthoria steineri]
MAITDEKSTEPIETKHSPTLLPNDEASASAAALNVSGHKQELQRNFNPLSLCALAITTGNVWIGLGGAITVAIYNGGPPGVIYEFIAVSVAYWIIAASIAELSSAIPSAGGVYHWATVTAGRYGRVCGWFAGWWNCLAWLLGTAAITQILASLTVSMYAVTHEGFVTQLWHILVAYLLFTWIDTFIVLYLNRALPAIETIAGFFVVAGCIITIVVCAVLPYVGDRPYATHASVWKDWTNQTGYSSDGFVFCLGMLNGAFSVGTPDMLSHLAEEVPKWVKPFQRKGAKMKTN